jgi:hypothetical protein
MLLHVRVVRVMFELSFARPVKTRCASSFLSPISILGALAAYICVCAAGSSSAQAQTVNLSTNATINVPVISGPTTVSVPVNVLGNVVNLNVNVTGTPGGLNLLPTSVTLPVTISGSTVSLSLNVTAGTIPILGGQTTISLPIGITLPTAVLPAVLGSTGSIISNRRNDTLLGLDLGLERQVDLLTGSGTDATSVWSDPMALGGMRLGDVLNTGSSRDPLNGDQISFATSLQQARQDNASANQPYGLGAASRRSPPAKSPFDIWAEGSFARFEDGNEASQREGIGASCSSARIVACRPICSSGRWQASTTHNRISPVSQARPAAPGGWLAPTLRCG